MTISHDRHHLDSCYQWVPDDEQTSGWLILGAIVIGFPLAIALMPLWPWLIPALERRGYF